MTEKRFTADDIENMVWELGTLLIDESQGIIGNTLKENFFEKYKDFDTITAWGCLVEEINRIDAVIELHDFLADCNREDLELLLKTHYGD